MLVEKVGVASLYGQLTQELKDEERVKHDFDDMKQ